MIAKERFPLADSCPVCASGACWISTLRSFAPSRSPTSTSMLAWYVGNTFKVGSLIEVPVKNPLLWSAWWSFCFVCAGRGLKSHAYTHSVQFTHHVFLNLHTLKFYCLPDNYEIIDSSLEDITVSDRLTTFQHTTNVTAVWGKQAHSRPSEYPRAVIQDFMWKKVYLIFNMIAFREDIAFLYLIENMRSYI